MGKEKGIHFSLKHKSIRTQLIVYMGCFVVLPLCLALMVLNIYLQRVTTENKTGYDTTLLSQIKANADQMIEVTNYSTSMMMTSKSVLENLRTMARSEDRSIHVPGKNPAFCKAFGDGKLCLECCGR